MADRPIKERTAAPLRGGRGLPRGVYWGVGALIAFAGAIAGRLLSEIYPDSRFLIYFAAAAAIFLGLAVLSLGTRAHQRHGESERTGAGAGEGDRTLV